jgi:hypothetical protein
MIIHQAQYVEGEYMMADEYDAFLKTRLIYHQDLSPAAGRLGL